MKKLLFLLLISGTTVFSQVKIRPGARLGINVSNISSLENTSSKTGLNAGLFVNVHFSHFYELQLETSYSNQGAEIKYNSSRRLDPIFTVADDNLDLEYISIGVINKFFIIKDSGLHLMVGPSIDVNIGDGYADFTPIDLSFTLGIAYELPFGLTVEARYKQGIIDLDDGFTTINSNDDYYDEGKNYLNSTIQIGASYKFDF